MTANEYNLKLARIYATAKFINWPDEAGQAGKDFVIAVVAPDPFSGGLRKLDGRKLKERSIQTKIISSADDVPSCHLLFIPEGADPKLVNQILEKYAKLPVLVWRDKVDPTSTVRSACTFIRQGENILIDTDPTELQRVGLSPDGRLMSLNLVRIVKSN